MTLSHWQYATREPEVACEVAVVGGGILGCSVAYWLRQLRPGHEVVVVEAERLAGGASGRNAGFLLQGASTDYLTDVATHGGDRTRRLWHFTRENRDLIFSELRGRAFDLEASGSLTVAGTAEEDERLRSCVGRMRADGAPVAYIPAEETNRRLVSTGFLGSLYVPSGGMVNPASLVRHVAAQSGATVFENHPVLEVTEQKGWTLVETPARRIRAGRVVFALGAYLPRLFPELGRYVRPVRAQMLATEPMLPRWLQIPAYSHEGFFYVRQAPDGAVLVGGARHLHLKDEVGYVDATTPALQHDLERFLHDYFPQTRGLRVVRRWSGVMGFSPDHLPVVGPAPGLPGSYWAGGFTGHGMAYAFRMGRLMAELALGYPRPDGYDLFSVERFADAALPAPGAHR